MFSYRYGSVSQELIQKSVRLPADLVDYVESCDGMTFTEKLVGILVDYRDGLSTKGRDLKRLRERYELCSQKLRKLQDIVESSYAVYMRAAVVMADVRDLNNTIGVILEEDDSS